MTYNTIRYQIADDGILLLALTRPERLNALTVEMCDDLVDVYGRSRMDDAVKAIVVTGEGRVFCTGMDLSV